jgi:hypothetical protein
MARESTMKTVHTACDTPMGDPWPSLTILSDHRMLSTLGLNLRDVYGEMVETAQPSDLVRLAAMIDERRSRTDG